MHRAGFWAVLSAALWLGAAAQAAERTLWGYGVRGCDAYLAAAIAADAGNAAELQRYEDWLTGFVSALNLALNDDVLRGSDLMAAMQGIRDYCRQNQDQDFFNAAMDQVRNGR
ncbi:hypothetical protein [uncultured Thiohalocapsa sp.]|uniref:hypothetical protein n=1 Tax=uncultured Thiohalocapsa sp. TaxID=768990 RepID=UPI0025D60AD1|nr:hypothetical protein [uncultured Thiohalocapsa sp.]